MSEDSGLDLERAREIFEASQDFTVGLEEEFAIVDPDSLELAHEFPAMMEACTEDELLATAAAGELIDTEIEIRSGRGEDFADAAAMQAEHRERLFALADRMRLGLASWGTHPWASYLDQQIIDTEHYNRLRGELQWVALRNNTWSNHVHVGIGGADRAIAVCDHLRELIPPLLALSANSPFLDGHDTGLHSDAHADLHPDLPALRRPRAVRRLGHVRRVHRAAARDGCDRRGDSALVERAAAPPVRDGRVPDLRRADGRRRVVRARGAHRRVHRAVGARLRRGPLPEPLAGREIEENFWRAIRWGLDGEMIDWRGSGEMVPTREVVERLVEWSAPAADAMKAEVALPERNGAMRSIDALERRRGARRRLSRRGGGDTPHLRARSSTAG